MWIVLSGLCLNLRTRDHYDDGYPHEQTPDAARMRVHAEDEDVHLLLGPA